MKLRWRPTNDVEAEILGHEHNDKADLHDVVANVCDGSSLGTGHVAAAQLVHRFNCFAELVADMEYAVQFLGDDYPLRTIKKRLLGGLSKAKHGVAEPMPMDEEAGDAGAT